MAEHTIGFKRIIEGKTYNTETAAKLASRSVFSAPHLMENLEKEETLFQTRHGAFFLYFFNPERERWDDGRQNIVPLKPNEAQRWAEQHCTVDVIESIFGEMPEAGNAEAKITLRMPEILRRRLAAMAESQGQSMNAAIVRCLEHCVASAAKPS